MAEQTKPPVINEHEHPEEWVLYLQQMLNWFYQMQVVSQDGKYGSQTRNAVEHLRGQLGMSREPVVDEELWKQIEGAGSSTGLGSGGGSGGSGGSGGGGGEGGVGEAVDRSVQLVAGDKDTSWATAIAMVASANNNTQTLDNVVAAAPQRRQTATEARQIARDRFAMTEHACHASQPESWAGVLRAHGPLWVQIPDDEQHVFVVAGIKAEGETAKVHVLDPHTSYDDWAEFPTFCEAYHFHEGTDIQVLAAG